MRYHFCRIIIIASLFLISTPAFARTVNMIFWYPGEAGSTSEAQPIIDLFFESVNQKISPDKMQGRYFNTVNEGIEYIKKRKPVAGIISYAAWVQNSDKLKGATVILSTLPLPGGKDTEQYTLVGSGSTKAAHLPIISSEPLSISFVRTNLFPSIAPNANISRNPQLLYNLKRIASGELKSQAILTPTEAATLKRLSSPWAKKLKFLAESKPVSSARVVLFDPKWKKSAEFKKAILSMDKDDDGQLILEELRLKGFAASRPTK